MFSKYFANEAIQAAAVTWLGPNYQMTAQVNLVHPGGSAQQGHRDYHLGFQTADISSSYPKHVHELSPVLTLQGAVAIAICPLKVGQQNYYPFPKAICLVMRLGAEMIFVKYLKVTMFNCL